MVMKLEPRGRWSLWLAAKARGMAEYMETHGTQYGRVELIDRIDRRVRSLDLKDPKVRSLLLTVANSEALVEIYRAHGTPS